MDTRVLGLPIPFHRDFDEVNLRFYVRRLVNGEVRRAVTFLRRSCRGARSRWWPGSRTTSRTSRAACGARPRTSPQSPIPARCNIVASPRPVECHTRSIRGPARALEAGSEAEFITEHYWGYTPQRDGGTVEYVVRHPVVARLGCHRRRARLRRRGYVWRAVCRGAERRTLLGVSRRRIGGDGLPPSGCREYAESDDFYTPRVS